MKRELRFTPSARDTLAALEADRWKAALLRQVRKTHGLLETRHPALQTHTGRSLKTQGGGDVFEAYVQQHTPAAFRVFFCYDPDWTAGRRRIAVITILAITLHAWKRLLRCPVRLRRPGRLAMTPLASGLSEQ